MSAPTYEDAHLMVQLVRWGTETGLNEATVFVLSDDFLEDFEEFEKKYPLGSQEHRYAMNICNWHESLAAFWVNGLMSEKLINDMVAVVMVWARIKNFALGIRDKYGNPSIYEHFEALAKALSE